MSLSEEDEDDEIEKITFGLQGDKLCCITLILASVLAGVLLVAKRACRFSFVKLIFL